MLLFKNKPVKGKLCVHVIALIFAYEHVHMTEFYMFLIKSKNYISGVLKSTHKYLHVTYVL